MQFCRNHHIIKFLIFLQNTGQIHVIVNRRENSTHPLRTDLFPRRPRPLAQVAMAFFGPVTPAPIDCIFSMNFSQTRGTAKNTVGRISRNVTAKVPWGSSEVDIGNYVNIVAIQFNVILRYYVFLFCIIIYKLYQLCPIINPRG